MNHDISIIITAHKEGEIAQASLRSALRCAEFARAKNITVEIVCTLDAADDQTQAMFVQFKDSIDQLIVLDHRDLGLSRNSAIQASHGKYIALLDADDLWSENWLYTCFHSLENRENKKQILHPEYSLFFEARSNLWKHRSQVEMNPDELSVIFFVNHWTALCFAHRDVFTDVPYLKSGVGSGFGFEDWHWNAETIGKGYLHSIVPGTSHFIRKKTKNSLLSLHRETDATIRKCSLFDLTHYFSPTLRDILGDYLTGARTSSVRHYEPAKFPGWLKELLLRASEIEPQLKPEPAYLSSFQQFVLTSTRAGRAYAEARNSLGATPPDLLILIDPDSIQEIESLPQRAITESSGSNCIMIALGSLNLKVRRKFPNLKWVEFHRLCEGLSEAEKETILLRLIIQTEPKRIFNLNSPLAKAMEGKFRKAIAEKSAWSAQ